MEFNELLEKRRSVRKYKADTTVDRETIEEILKAAQQAPTWKNSQTGRYYVVTSDEKLKEIKENCLLSRNGINAENAPVLIVTTFVKIYRAMKTVYDKIHEFQEIMEENTMYTLKLVILNEDLSIEERIHAGDRYIELHGNGYVHSIYDQLKKEVEQQHEHDTRIN